MFSNVTDKRVCMTTIPLETQTIFAAPPGRLNRFFDKFIHVSESQNKINVVLV